MTYALRDSATMLRRNLRRSLRYPVAAAVTVAMPIVLMLLFVFVFGQTMGAGLPGPGGGREEYLDYVTPGILLIGATGAAQAVAIAVAMDMTEGIVARFRTMNIARGSVLTGHVLGSLIQTMGAMVLVVGFALLLGFSPTAGPVEWIAAFGLLAAISFALIWLAVALGMVTKSVEAASNLPMPLVLLPFLGSGFVPVDSMPAGMRWFAEHQPFTPMMDTLRGLLMGTPIGSSGVVALAWCALIAMSGYLWARDLYERDPTP
jgi:ABC-2 type transport system permease protein